MLSSSDTDPTPVEPGSSTLCPRDKVLFSSIFVDAVVPFLRPKDLGKFALLSKECSRAVYDEYGKSVLTYLDSRQRFGEREFTVKNEGTNIFLKGFRSVLIYNYIM